MALAALISLSAAANEPAKKAKAKPDYSAIHGECYNGWRGSVETVKRDLGYGQKIGLNSTRIWMGPGQWQRDPQGFIKAITQALLFIDLPQASTACSLPNGPLSPTFQST